MEDEEEDEKPYKDSAERAEEAREKMFDRLEKIADKVRLGSQSAPFVYEPPPPPSPEEIEASKKDARNFNIRHSAIALFQKGMSADTAISNSIEFFDKLDAALPMRDRLHTHALFPPIIRAANTIQEELDSLKGE